MTTDAVIQIVQTIKSQLSQSQASALNSNSNLLGQVDFVVATAANYAQLLSTAGPITQAAAAAIVGSVAAEQTAGAAAEATALAGAGATGVGAGIVLIASIILAALAASEQSGSSDFPQLLTQLNTAVSDIENGVLASYWQDKITTIMGFWTSPTGGLGTDLDNLANGRHWGDGR